MAASASDRVFDVIVIGGGIAGWTAARRAQRNGASVVLVEKSDRGPGWSNSIVSGARIHASYLNPRTRSADDLYAQIMRKTDGRARPDVARAWAENTGRAVDFLESEGAEIGLAREVSPEPGIRNEYGQTEIKPGAGGTPDYFFSPEPWRGRGPELLLTKMWHAFERDGGTFRPSVRAIGLELTANAVTGVRAEGPGGAKELIRGRAVIMADGGFQANRDLMRKYGVTSHRYRLHGSENDSGDCLLMSLAIGAKIVEMPTFYGSLVLLDGLTKERLRRAASPGALIETGIVVSSEGGRVGDEGRDATEERSPIEMAPLTDAVAKAPGSGDCWVVFDDHVWETVGRSTAGPGAAARLAQVAKERNPAAGGMPAINPFLVDEGGTLESADSVERLAGQIGVAPAALRRTVDEFNRFCREGGLLTPPRSGKPAPIERSPFHAIPICVAYYFTIGGVLVNAHGRVLNEREEPIPGLYAAGGTMGGLGGGPRNGYPGGWSEASTFGLLAAEHAVSLLRTRAR